MSEAIKKLERQFHPNYHTVIKLKHLAVTIEDSSVSKNDTFIEEKIDFCGGLLAFLNKADPGHSTRIWRAIANEMLRTRILQLQLAKARGQLGKDECMKRVAQYVAEMKRNARKI